MPQGQGPAFFVDTVAFTRLLANSYLANLFIYTGGMITFLGIDDAPHIQKAWSFTAYTEVLS